MNRPVDPPHRNTPELRIVRAKQELKALRAGPLPTPATSVLRCDLSGVSGASNYTCTPPSPLESLQAEVDWLEANLKRAGTAKAPESECHLMKVSLAAKYEQLAAVWQGGSTALLVDGVLRMLLRQQRGAQWRSLVAIEHRCPRAGAWAALRLCRSAQCTVYPRGVIATTRAFDIGAARPNPHHGGSRTGVVDVRVAFVLPPPELKKAALPRIVGHEVHDYRARNKRRVRGIVGADAEAPMAAPHARPSPLLAMHVQTTDCPPEPKKKVVVVRPVLSDEQKTALFRENESAGYAKAQHDREAAAREHEAWRAALLEKILAGYTVPFLEQEAAAVKRRRETWLRYGRDKNLEPVSRERLARVPKPAWFKPLVESEESVLQTVYVVPMRATYRGGASGYYVISADDVETASASFFAEKEIWLHIVASRKATDGEAWKDKWRQEWFISLEQLLEWLPEERARLMETSPHYKSLSVRNKGQALRQFLQLTATDPTTAMPTHKWVDGCALDTRGPEVFEKAAEYGKRPRPVPPWEAVLVDVIRKRLAADPPIVAKRHTWKYGALW